MLFIVAFIAFIVYPSIFMRVYSLHLITSFRFNNLYFGVFIIVLCFIFVLILMSFLFIFFITNILLTKVVIMILILVLGYTFVLIIHIFTLYADSLITSAFLTLNFIKTLYHYQFLVCSYALPMHDIFLTIQM